MDCANDEYISQRVFELSQLGNEMCYKTSKMFIDFFPGELEEKTFNNFEDLSKYILHREFEIYNIEIHLELEITEFEKKKLISNLPIRGLMKHVVNKPGKLRLFTHAFNILLNDDFSIYQSWGNAHEYRRVIRSERKNLNKYLNDISLSIKNILNNPQRLFTLFGLTSDEFSKMCDYPVFYRLVKRIEKSGANDTKLQILVERKSI